MRASRWVWGRSHRRALQVATSASGGGRASAPLPARRLHSTSRAAMLAEMTQELRAPQLTSCSRSHSARMPSGLSLPTRALRSVLLRTSHRASAPRQQRVAEEYKDTQTMHPHPLLPQRSPLLLRLSVTRLPGARWPLELPTLPMCWEIHLTFQHCLPMTALWRYSAIQCRPLASSAGASRSGRGSCAARRAVPCRASC